MRRRPQIPIGRRLQHLAKVHQIRALDARRIDHPVAKLHLQPANVVLQNERQQARVLMQTDALPRFIGLVDGWRGRVANDLEMHVRVRHEAGVELIDRLSESDRERSKRGQPDRIHRRHPREGRDAKLR